jgi:2-pyrone-4,6-dicarboxylate lactonase
MPEPKPSFHPSPSKPRFQLPKGSCDAHVHVFGPGAVFPYAEGAPFIPADAPKEKLFAMHAAIGVERCVMVQSTCHGFDNSAIEDAIKAKGGAYKGVALAPVNVDDRELSRLARAGFYGVRFNFMSHLGKGPKIEEVIALTRRLAEIGWHLQVHFEIGSLKDLEPWFRKSAVPVVIDHMGRFDASAGLDQPGFKLLCELLEDDRFWVKVSGSERCTRQAPPYADAIPFARKLVNEFGDRAVWGTDWPHPNLNHVPDDGALADLLLEIAPSEQQRKAVLVDNPNRLYFTRP